MRLIILLLVLCTGGICRGNSDLDALLEFRKGIRDRSGRLSNTWISSSSLDQNGCPQDWFGIQCNENRVSSIALNDLGLVGNVSWSVFQKLDMLRNLSLSNNSLSGVVSPEIGLVSSLEQLDLSFNAFAGPLPSEMVKMQNLLYLNLSSNSFDGELPSSLGNLRKLRYLDLRANSFTGHVDVIISQLERLAHIDISQNGFSGAIKLTSDNSNFGSYLEYLNVSHNNLSGELFADGPMPSFDSLEVLDASNNQLSGQIPSFLAVSLEKLRLRNNRFSGSLPEALFNENSVVLAELDLSNNQLKGPIKGITSTTLKTFNLSFNEFSGSLPTKIGSCAVVDLSNNKLSGNLSAIRSWGENVEDINLSSNLLTGTLTNETSKFLRLSSFKVSSNQLFGELPLVLGTYPKLDTVDLSINQLYGHIPPSLFSSVSLTSLNLSGNQFSGPLTFSTFNKAYLLSPDVLLPGNQRSSLASLDLSNNSLTGLLPPDIASINGLKLLNIGNNNISGQIPRELGMLRSLLYLDLSHNLFEGGIPDNLPGSLLEFNVSYNNLSGAIPESLRRFPESSFHPGNSFLVFVNVTPPFNRQDHGHRMRVAIIYALIVGSVACFAVIIILIVMYHKLSYSRSQTSSVGQRKPISRLFGPHRSAEARAVSLSFSQDQLLSPRSSSMPLEHVDSHKAAFEHAETGGQISTKSGNADYVAVTSSAPRDGTKSPMSIILSSPHNSDAGRCSISDVRSPDRLAGDLHLFDNAIIFTAEELSRAPAEIIGRSCHGTSYKATLDNGHVLTVKWLREGITKGKKEFAREAKKLGSIRHPNIVPLRGYYWGPREHERLIISDYIDAASLAEHLCGFESKGLLPLPLSQRISIAVDIARCLSYLHNERAIPHGNLKSSNILLQIHNSNTLLTDYSLHRIMTPAGMAEQVLNSGALGYRPPEFASTNKPCPSLKSDIYAFGVVLLELLTGKNAGEIVSGNPGIVDLTDWVKLLASENRSHECFDRFITEVDNPEEPLTIINAILTVALRCIRSASERPEIKTVFEELSSISI